MAVRPSRSRVALIGAEEMMTDVAEDITHGVGVHSLRQVGTYRAHILDKGGHVARPSIVFEAPNDATAIARARALAGDDAHIEVWEGSRRVDPTNPTSGHPPATRSGVPRDGELK
jgi:hypothetical protein